MCCWLSRQSPKSRKSPLSAENVNATHRSAIEKNPHTLSAVVSHILYSFHHIRLFSLSIQSSRFCDIQTRWKCTDDWKNCVTKKRTESHMRQWLHVLKLLSSKLTRNMNILSWLIPLLLLLLNAVLVVWSREKLLCESHQPSISCARTSRMKFHLLIC